MLVVIVLVVLLVLVAAVGLVVWIRRAASCGRTTDAPQGARARSFIGDVLCRSAMTSGGFARLEFFDWGVRLRGVAVVSRWIVPTWEARYDELALAELVTLRFSRIAVWLRVRGEAGGIGFLSGFSEEILRELEARDVPVSRAVAQVRSTAELYARGPQ
ncbi:MAG TPA: hypothetical protein VMB74_12705 [Streptosporangiaceae bacterium]|nr:hypothetical protein [Streptosporangiaceae bacterium]